MKNLYRSIAVVGICLVSLFLARPVLAFPPLPSSFYGTVKINQANVPDGTLVKALINGQVFAQTKTLTYQGDSVYSLDVMGDDSDTALVDGGVDGDTIVFIIGEEVADQTGTWKSGTNVNLNITASTQAPTLVPTTTQIPAVPGEPIPVTSGGATASPGFNQKFILAGAVLVVLILAAVLWFILKRKQKA
jgi:hypothetical protein